MKKLLIAIQLSRKSNKQLFWFVIIYLAIMLGFMSQAPLSPDTYYYWQWSKHLSLSYYDGPPLIAYVIDGIVHLFGRSELSLYSISLISLIITAAAIYRIAYNIFSKEIANLALMLWLLMPGVVHYFIFQTTYNTVMIIFWSLTLLCFFELITSKASYWYYLTGLCFGLLLLSKYTGILLGASLFLYALCDKKAQFIFSSHHLYLALVLALLIFSPVLIWNYQHQWISFAFQLHHGFKGGHGSINASIKHYLLTTITNYNLAFIILLIGTISCYKEIIKNKFILFLLFPTWFVWLFFFVG